MKTQCEMLVYEYFKLSEGHVAFVGEIIPNIDELIPKCKADLYIGEYKVRTINIIGEDRFSGGDKELRLNKRAVRTDDDVTSELTHKRNEIIRLIFNI